MDLTFADWSTEKLEATWRHLRELLLAALHRKLADPSRVQSVDTSLEAALRDYDAAAAEVAGVNEAIADANEKIAEIKKRAAATDEEELEAELRRLRNMQIRQEPEVCAMCDKLTGARADRQSLEQRKEESKTKLRELAANVLGEYETTINRFLGRFGASFTIAETKPSWAGGKASSTYKLLINDQTMKLGDARTPRGTPCFRTALSAGDKSTLALAFFFARLERDDDIGSKIVVLDDPLSSLDEFRLACTQQDINALAGRAGQVVLLSHNAFFLKRVYDSHQGGTIKTLRVEPVTQGVEVQDG